MCKYICVGMRLPPVYRRTIDLHFFHLVTPPHLLLILSSPPSVAMVQSSMSPVVIRFPCASFSLILALIPGFSLTRPSKLSNPASAFIVMHFVSSLLLPVHYDSNSAPFGKLQSACPSGRNDGDDYRYDVGCGYVRVVGVRRRFRRHDSGSRNRRWIVLTGWLGQSRRKPCGIAWAAGQWGRRSILTLRLGIGFSRDALDGKVSRFAVRVCSVQTIEVLVVVSIEVSRDRFGVVPMKRRARLGGWSRQGWAKLNLRDGGDCNWLNLLVIRRGCWKKDISVDWRSWLLARRDYSYVPTGIESTILDFLIPNVSDPTPLRYHTGMEITSGALYNTSN